MWKPQAAIAATILVLSGCAAIQGQTATDSEQILTQAGFTRQPESAAAGGATVNGGRPVQARQLTKVTENGSVAYEFYDPQFCHCVYVGGDKEYAELQRVRNARVADHQRLLMTQSGVSSPPDSMWGPWKPEGLDLK